MDQSDLLRIDLFLLYTLAYQTAVFSIMILCIQALLQTVEREEREMRELDAAKDALIDLCTPGGRDALTLEIAHLHDLCADSEKEIKERLVVCETRMSDIDLKISDRTASLSTQAECILNELRAQECIGFIEGNKNISQLQKNWNILKVLVHILAFINIKIILISNSLNCFFIDM